MRYLSVCSGIEAATVAWHPLGWTPAAFSEIDPFPRAVLKHHYPKVKCHGDFTTIGADDYGPIDVLVGGTPCQDFSIAGLREGLAGMRGNLTLEFLRLAARKKPRWIVWENVPGVLSSISHAAPDPLPPADPVDLGLDAQEVVTSDEYSAEELHALNSFLAGLSELGYGFAYVVRDAQHFGLAQRRARVFVVGYLGDWRPAAAVLFERESLRGDTAPGREPGERPAPTIAARTEGGGGLGTDFDLDGGVIAGTLGARSAAHPSGLKNESEFAIANAIHAADHAHKVRRDGDNLIPATTPALDASYGRLQGTSGQDLNHGHGHLLAFGGNRTSGPLEVATARNGHTGPHGRLDFETETFIAQAFKTSHFTRGKDGKPSELAPALSADADKGDQDTLIAFSAKDSGHDITDDLAPTLRGMSENNANANANGGGQIAIVIPFDTTQITHPENRSNPQPRDASPSLAKGAHPPAIAFESRVARNGRGAPDTIVPPLKARSGDSGRGDSAPLVAFGISSDAVDRTGEGAAGSSTARAGLGITKEKAPSLRTRAQAVGFARVADPVTANQAGKYAHAGNNSRPSNVAHDAMQVRRLTPRECERLQGFPDDYTLVSYRKKPAADGPRYKSLGNSMAVNVMAWIGARIQMVEDLIGGNHDDVPAARRVHRNRRAKDPDRKPARGTRQKAGKHARPSKKVGRGSHRPKR